MSARSIDVATFKKKKVEPKWQHLAQAASKSNLEGLATALAEELQLNGQKELQESVDETKGGKYKIASKINHCVY